MWGAGTRVRGGAAAWGAESRMRGVGSRGEGERWGSSAGGRGEGRGGAAAWKDRRAVPWRSKSVAVHGVGGRENGNASTWGAVNP